MGRAHLLLAATCICTAGAVPADAQWVIGGYLGAARTISSALSVAQPTAGTDVTFASVDYDGESFTPPVYYGYRIGYFLPQVPWLGVEAEFIHLKAYARTDALTRASGRDRGMPVDRDVPIRDILESFSISHGLNFALVNVVARRPLGGRAGAAARVALLGRLGIGPTIPHAESQIGGISREGYEIGAPGLHLAGGVEVRMWRELAAMTEYKLTRTDQNVAIHEGQAHGRFTSHHGVFGLAWHF